MDISEEMLKAAETHPVRQEAISVKQINVIRGNAYLTSFAPESFHFIYSLGMFGNGCPVNVEICNRFYDWLTPGGKLYFNVPWISLACPFVCGDSNVRAQAFCLSMLSRRLKNVLDEHESRHPLPFHDPVGFGIGSSQNKIQNFPNCASHVCQSPLWTGRHLECIANKPA